MTKFLPNELYPIDLDKSDLIQIIDDSIKIKKKVLQMINRINSGHPGGSLSCIDILTCLYSKILNINPEDPHNLDRDILILSKGHAAPALYATLSQFGFFSDTILSTFREIKSKLQGHPKKQSVPGIEISTGSLGMGASIAVGMALAAKMDDLPKKIYAILGDGECDEGVVWEAAMSASHFGLDNLIFIIDRNSIQLDGPTEKIMSIEPFSSKWEAFGWHVIEIDGMSIKEILMAFETAKFLKGRPTVIIAYLIKGQGVKFMQHVKEFHGKPPNQEELQKAFKDLEEYRENLIKSNGGLK